MVAGGTGSGKTTLANALLHEIAQLGERVVILEDTRELQCAAEDVVALRTQPGSVSLSDLVRSTLRLRPDRIVVGEVRGPEALDLLKAWNTGHPGGIATLHANSAQAALSRLEQLTMEVCETPPRALIAEAIDLIVFVERGGPCRPPHPGNPRAQGSAPSSAGPHRTPARGARRKRACLYQQE
jgi:Flp pilus assembly CpaF family ATPase